MKSNEILVKLKNEIKELSQFPSSSFFLCQEKNSDLLKKESSILTKIVNYFHEILLDNFNILEVQNNKKPETTQKDIFYWDFISKHFNNQVADFCRELDKNDNNKGIFFLQKCKNWIYFSILENSFYDSINEIYNQGLIENYYKKMHYSLYINLK